MKTYAFVFARGGSKGVPGKNIRDFGGRPLLAYPVSQARGRPDIAEVFVSTDNAAISAVAREWGATVIPRPAELAQDDSPEWAAWRHAVKWVNAERGPFDVFLSLPATAPLRSDEDIQACLDRLDSATDIVVTVTESPRSPWFNMVRFDAAGYARLLIDAGDTYHRRQDVPVCYDITTVAYATRPQFILEADRIFDGRVRAVTIPGDRALDIDTETDFRIGEMLINAQRGRNRTC